MTMPNKQRTLAGSFRDPSGFLYLDGPTLLRQINLSYAQNYELLMQSGLYLELTNNKNLITHEEIDIKGHSQKNCYKTIKPAVIPFISYPYEWSFGQLKDAALLTLHLQKIAIKYGMSLKDASAYNIQFLNGRPIFIDTLSFEKLESTEF